MALITEEALYTANTKALEAWVAGQPPWSDFPFVILTSHLIHPKIALWRQQISEKLNNVSMLERPLRPISLSSSIQVAIRARRKQIEVKNLIQAREQAALELEGLVVAQTAAANEGQ